MILNNIMKNEGQQKRIGVGGGNITDTLSTTLTEAGILSRHGNVSRLVLKIKRTIAEEQDTSMNLTFSDNTYLSLIMITFP